MADYYTKVSITVAMTAEQYAWLNRLHTAVVDRVFGDTEEGWLPEPDIAEPYAALAEFEDGCGIEAFDYQADGAEPGLWLYGDTVNCDYLAALLQQFLIYADEARYITFEWANDCSRPRTDAFGGGAFVVSRDDIRGMATSTWCEETMKQMDAEKAQAKEG